MAASDAVLLPFALGQLGGQVSGVENTPNRRSKLVEIRRLVQADRRAS